jgi:hypothetical protein
VSAGFTPGPWQLAGTHTVRPEWFDVIDSDGRTKPYTLVARSRTRANANLIAAAPDLRRELGRLQMLAERFIEACPAKTHKATQARNILYTAIDDAHDVLSKAGAQS